MRDAIIVLLDDRDIDVDAEVGDGGDDDDDHHADGDDGSSDAGKGAQRLHVL